MQILGFRNTEELRSMMIDFHRQAQKSDLAWQRDAHTQKQAEFYRGRATCHDTMVDFWQHVQLPE